MTRTTRMTRTWAGVVAGLGLLSACAVEPPVVHPDPVPANPPVVLQQVQASRILADLAGDLQDSTGGATVEALLPRLDGVALLMRTAELKLAAALPDHTPTGLGTEFVGTAIEASDTWPRSFIAATKSIESYAPFLYLLTQVDPWSDYKLVQWVQLVPGVTVPETADPRVGSATLPFDAEGLTMTPQAALDAYAAMKADPAAPEAGYFSGDPDPARQYWTALMDAWSALAAFETNQVKQSHRASQGVGIAMETAVGGAIVMGQVTSGLAVTFQQAAGEEGGHVEVPAEWAALADKDQTARTSASISYVQTVALWVPPAGSSDKITVLGVAQVPTEASLT